MFRLRASCAASQDHHFVVVDLSCFYLLQNLNVSYYFFILVFLQLDENATTSTSDSTTISHTTPTTASANNKWYSGCSVSSGSGRSGFESRRRKFTNGPSPPPPWGNTYASTTCYAIHATSHCNHTFRRCYYHPCSTHGTCTR